METKENNNISEDVIHAQYFVKRVNEWLQMQLKDHSYYADISLTF